MSFIRLVITKLVSILSPEAWGYVLFILGASIADSYKKYLLVMGLYVAMIWFFKRNLKETLWLCYFSVFIVDRTIDTVIPYPLLPTEFAGFMKGSLEWSFSVNMAEIFLALLIVVLVFERKNSKKENENLLADWKLVLMTLFGGIAALRWGGFYDYPWYGLLIWIKYLMVYAIAKKIWVGNRNLSKIMLEMLGVWCLANVTLMGWQWVRQGNVGLAIEDSYLMGRFADEDPLLFRPGGMSWNANLTSGMLLMSLPLLIAGTGGGLINLKVGIIMSIGCLAGILLGSSRFVWITLPVVSLIMWRWWGDSFWKKARLLVIKYQKLLFLLILALLLIAIPRLWSLVNTTGFEYRWNHFKITYKEIMTRPWGLGPDMYRFQLASNYEPSEYYFVPSPQHNIFLEVATGFGLVGLGLFGWWLWGVMRIISNGKTNNLSASLRILWLSSLIFLLLGQVYSMLFSATITQLWWIAMGFLNAEIHKKYHR